MIEVGILGKRMELIRGLIIEKMSKSPLHSYAATELCRRIEDTVGKHYYCRVEQPLTFADSEPEPGVSIVRGTAKEFRASHPRTAALVTEVAVSSAALDRENASLYAENGVDEYWVVFPLEKRAEIYRRSENDRYLDHRMTEAGEIIQCGSIPEIRIDLEELFAGED